MAKETPAKRQSPLASRPSPLAWTLAATLLVKLWLAWLIPMSGDEAYFVVWAQHLDFGYYDHPPMVGWFLHLLLYLGNNQVLLRLPAILLSTLIGLGIYRLLREQDRDKARLAAILFLLAPINVLNILVTTDTPLILFAFASAALLYRALSSDRLGTYALSGAFLGLAFLSKYFAVLLGFSYLVYFAVARREKKALTGFLILILAALPFVALNLYWNYTHCWDNILFNLMTRQQDARFSPGNVLLYLVMELYLLTPPLVYYLIRHRAELSAKLGATPQRLFLFAFLVPAALFALMSFKKTVGLHWVLGFYPFLFLMTAALPLRELLKSARFMAWFALAHLLLVAAIALTPMTAWKHTRLYDGIVFMFKTGEVVQQIRLYEPDYLLATDGYTPSAILSYHTGKYFFVFGEGSYHARQDDLLTDFRQMAGKNILILKKSKPDAGQYAPYFRQVEIKSFELYGAPFYLVLGKGFDFDRYRQEVLSAIKARYYAIPGYLPTGNCYFCEKYFPTEPCTAKAP